MIHAYIFPFFKFLMDQEFHFDRKYVMVICSTAKGRVDEARAREAIAFVQVLSLGIDSIYKYYKCTLEILYKYYIKVHSYKSYLMVSVASTNSTNAL